MADMKPQAIPLPLPSDNVNQNKFNKLIQGFFVTCLYIYKKTPVCVSVSI